jgi:hypothetical protein
MRPRSFSVISSPAANTSSSGMPHDLTLYGRPIGTVFDLLGDKENDLTYSDLSELVADHISLPVRAVRDSARDLRAKTPSSS